MDPLARPGVAVIVVTWNRKKDADAVLGALARQDYPCAGMDVVVVDNASGDGTVDHLTETWRPERVIENPTHRAHEPAFDAGVAPGLGPNRGGFRSLTLIHNHENHGGCGGFNTGFAFVQDRLDGPGASDRPDYVWLVDDDVDLPPDALRTLVDSAERDPSIGLVGSRTCDLNNRAVTIESTIYFDPARGLMTDEPPAGHRLERSHHEWAARVGGPKGRGPFSGTREVDVVSACSLLARWEAVRQVGFWDHRFFIYCDDADWCLRFARAGYKVVCNLDAVVYHTPWHHKQTPTRTYYALRNVVWMLQKSLSGWKVRRVTLRWMAVLLRNALRASIQRRQFAAEITRRTAHDLIRNRGGRLDRRGGAEPPKQDLAEALESISALLDGARIVILCSHPQSLAWADRIRDHVMRGRSTTPEWVYLVRSDVPGAGERSPGVTRVLYSRSLRSRLYRQLPLLFPAPAAVIIFDQSNDLPLLRGRFNVHVDRRDPDRTQVERDGFAIRAAFLARWLWTACLAVPYSLTRRRYISSGRYG